MNLNDDLKKRMRLPWSTQAIAMLAGLSEDFPIEDFERWVMSTKFIVGGGYITEFLEIQLNKKKQQEAENATLEKIQNIFPDSKQI